MVTGIILVGGEPQGFSEFEFHLLQDPRRGVFRRDVYIGSQNSHWIEGEIGFLGYEQ